ncbi:uncharacterized protein gpr63 isoform X2 [Mobula hypostoma]|uniref:uncharacterized protein gpr63 isoform X2 n=1 Tax=Mobula hypostoma TaxID=723540 RepID=UPI002FC37A11
MRKPVLYPTHGTSCSLWICVMHQDVGHKHSPFEHGNQIVKVWNAVTVQSMAEGHYLASGGMGYFSPRVTAITHT